MALCNFRKFYHPLHTSMDKLVRFSPKKLTIPHLFILILHHLCVSSHQMLAGLWLHVWDARLLCSPGMNPSERSLEYSLLNLGEGHRMQPFPALLPNEQTYGHGAP